MVPSDPPTGFLAYRVELTSCKNVELGCMLSVHTASNVQVRRCRKHAQLILWWQIPKLAAFCC